MTNPDVSVVILSCNHWEHTSCALGSLAGTRGVESETIVIDNGSDTSTREALTACQGTSLGKRLRLRCRFNGTNRGIASGRNQGADLARGRQLLFLDNDVEIIEPDWLGRLLDGMASDRTVAVAGSLLLHPGPARRVQFAGGFVDREGNLEFCDRLPDVFSSSDRLVLCDFCLGASLLVCREHWDLLGGFDTDFDPMDYEDIDFCLKTQQLGFACAVVVDSRLVHRGHVTTGTRGFERVRNYLVNGRRFKRRWQASLAARSDRPGPRPIER